jgi:hypothetical protein
MEDAKALVLHMMDTVENNVIPVNLFQGELFCSRFGIHIDDYENPEGNRVLFRVLDLIDGTRSIADLANTCGVGFAAVKGIIQELLRHKVVSIKTQVGECAPDETQTGSTSRLAGSVASYFAVQNSVFAVPKHRS